MAAFEHALHSLDQGASVGQLGAELLLGIVRVACLVHLGVIVEANVPARAGVAVVLPQRVLLFIQSVLGDD